jgi:hypothetical protein
MTRAGFIKEHSRAITDALALLPKDLREKARPAVEHALLRGVELSIFRFAEMRDESACAFCKDYLNRVIKPLQIED